MLIYWITLIIIWAYSAYAFNLCMGTEHSSGRWIQISPLKAQKSFSCCSSNYDKRAPSLAEPPKRCYRGLWYDVRGVDYYNTMMYPPINHGCDCLENEMKQNSTLTRETITNAELYVWKPLGCRIISWNASQFCDLLKNRTLLFVGDSTMQQSASTLISHLIHAGPNSSYCLPNISYRLSDRLLPMPAGRSQDLLLPAIKAVNPDILVFTAGAHYHWLYENQKQKVGKKSFLNDFDPKFHKVFTEINQLFPNMTKVYRTENPGHNMCHNATNPIFKTITANMSFEEKNEWGFSHIQTHAYYWHHGGSIDKLFIQRASIYNFSILDMSPLYLRPDAHPYSTGDCLHYCTPGPLDLFPRLLLHKLYTGEI